MIEEIRVNDKHTLFLPLPKFDLQAKLTFQTQQHYP